MPTSALHPEPQLDCLQLPRGRTLALADRPLVMGVLNITPDSFSDGGLWLEADRAIEHGRRLLAAGADLLDLGAESTRPGGGVYGAGAETVTPAEEMRRLLPVLKTLRDETEAPLSVDTRKGEVAQAALDAGGDLLNDVSLLSDPLLAAAAAEADCPLILMHSRGELATMQHRSRYGDLLADVGRELAEAVQRALAAGVRRQQILVDPGIGFAKTARQSLELLGRLDELQRRLGLPLVVGASRKSFIATAAGEAPAARRLGGSLAAAAWAAAAGAGVVRVHDVAETSQFLRVWQGIRAARERAS